MEPSGNGRFLDFLPPGARPKVRPAVDCKPGPVPTRGFPLASEDHSSRRRVSAPLEHSHPGTGTLDPPSPHEEAQEGRALRAGHPLQRPYSSLLPEGLASPPVARLSRVGSYPTISPLPVPGGHGAHRAIGGVISVALSLGSPRVGVTDFRTLRSPDFPPADGSCPPAILRPPPSLRD